MSPSFFFYDLETSGLRPSEARIMQFAGQRTDMNLNPIGESVNKLIKLTPDILPEPDAILLTGITPQQTLECGITEAAFLNLFYEDVALPGTIFVGFNNVRFDDEFIRFTNYRNFYDAYIWQWKDGRSRWDILDLVRMTRALRPEGINWPFSKEGKPVNRLEILTTANKLEHSSAHDALSDVYATIAVAKLVKDNQPRLFNYLLGIKGKAEVSELVKQDKPFVYTSSHYSSDYLHTTIVYNLSDHTKADAALVYDLRQDPTPFLSMSAEELAEAWAYSEDRSKLRLPVKTLKFNRVPAIAPLSVIDEQAKARLSINMDVVNKNLALIKNSKLDFADKLTEAVSILDKTRDDKRVALDLDLDPDGGLYEGGFIDNLDRNLFGEIHNSSPDNLDDFRLRLHDKRLKQLLPLYKARNYPDSLNDSEANAWKDYCHQRFNLGGKSSRLNRYQERLNELSSSAKTKKQRLLLEELKSYIELVS
jgi:exodeoxyribonuclease-1